MNQVANHHYEFGPFRLDAAERLLFRDGSTVPLTPRVFDILLVLVENRGHLLSKEELLRRVWGDNFVEESNLTRNISTLRKALGETTDNHPYIETVPWRGYRFVAEVSGEPVASASLIIEEHSKARLLVEEVSEIVIPDNPMAARQPDEQAVTLSQPATTNAGWQPRRVALAVSVLLAIITGAAIYLFTSSRERTGEGVAAIRSIAVLPFKPLATDAGDEYLGLGMADTLITKLSSLRQITVRPTNAVLKYASPDQDSLAAGREQQVEAVLEGSIQRSGDRVRLTVRLMNVRDGLALWAYKCDEQCADFFAIQDAISEKVASALALELTGEEKRQLAKRYTNNLEAYQLYMKGVFLRNRMTEDELKKSRDCFEKAIELDPHYALAYCGLASSNSPLAHLGYVPVREAEARNRRLITKALELDETLAEAHAALAEFRLFIEWDWEGAERAFKRALELNPSESLSQLLYPDLLLIKGRPEEAIAMSRAAFESDPLSPRTGKGLAWVYYYAGRYDEAIEQFNKTRELFPDYSMINSGPSYEQKGMYEQAVKEYLDAEARQGLSATEITALRLAYTASGWRGYWQKRLELALSKAGQQPVQTIFLAYLYARVGNKARALEWLEKAYGERNMSLIFLNVDPAWKSLQSESRFRDLLRHLKLPA